MNRHLDGAVRRAAAPHARTTCSVAPLGLLYISGPQRTLVQLDRAAQALLALPRDALIGHSLLELVHPDDRNEVAARIAKGVAEGLEATFACRLSGACQPPRRVSMACLPLGCADEGVCAALRDLDVQPSGDLRLAMMGEQRLLDILDNTSAVIYAKDHAGRYLLVNRQFESLFGLTREQVAGKTDFDIFSHDMAMAFRTNDLAVLNSGEILEVEEVAPHNDGLHTYISIKFPLRNEAGEIYAMAGISTDITDRIRAQRELDRLRHRTELILNSIGDGIYGIDRDGKTMFINPAAEKMLGWKAAELIGKPLRPEATEALPTTPADSESPVLDALRRGKQHQADNETFQRRDGSMFPVDLVSNPVCDQGEVVGAVVTFRDASGRLERMQAQQELQTARAVQHLLYPIEPPRLAGFDIAGAVYPARLACGDYFDFIPRDDGVLDVAVGDVSGHGLAPALEMVETRAYLRAILATGAPLREAVNRLNRFLVEDLADGTFVSLLLARIDARDRSLRYVGAGHDARLLRADGNMEVLPSSGLVLGLKPEDGIAVGQPQTLAAGDVLLLITDGVTEAESPQREQFGWNRTLEVVQAHRHLPATQIVDRLHQAVQQHAGEEQQADDLTIVVVKADQARV